jgi:hypothetical protein
MSYNYKFGVDTVGNDRISKRDTRMSLQKGRHHGWNLPSIPSNYMLDALLIKLPQRQISLHILISILSVIPLIKVYHTYLQIEQVI